MRLWMLVLIFFALVIAGGNAQQPPQGKKEVIQPLLPNMGGMSADQKLEREKEVIRYQLKKQLLHLRAGRLAMDFQEQKIMRDYERIIKSFKAREELIEVKILRAKEFARKQRWGNVIFQDATDEFEEEKRVLQYQKARIIAAKTGELTFLQRLKERVDEQILFNTQQLLLLDQPLP